MSLQKRAFAECLGTFWLVFAGCGSAVLAAAFPILGIGFLGVKVPLFRFRIQGVMSRMKKCVGDDESHRPGSVKQRLRVVV